MPSCDCTGEFRAPKSRTTLNEYWWFCLAHVRAYNAAWDFYKGMSPGQIEAQLRADTAWQRPTWPLGRLGGGGIDEDALRETLDLMTAGRTQARRRATERPPEELREPLTTLGLDWPTTLAQVKARYKTLAKRHHPDANGGDRVAEERLKVINLAYAALRTRLSADLRPAAAG